MHFHFVSAHFGGPPPWRHHPVSKNHQISLHYYDDSNTPSRVLAMHPRLKAKVPKMLEWRFVNADWYVWLDSSIELNPNADLPANILKWSNGHPLCLFRHSKATSIQEEAQLILNQLEQKHLILSAVTRENPFANSCFTIWETRITAITACSK